MKVFDCQDMPQDIRDLFYSFYECGNDVWVSWGIADSVDDGSEAAKQRKKIDDWFVANGADPAPDENSSGETILVNYWW